MATQIRHQDGITIVEPIGKIMGSAVSELREAIGPQIEGYDAPRILINFEHVNMIDSSGLSALIEASALVHRKDGRVGIIHVRRHVKNLIILSRLIRLFERFDSEDAAVSALST